ncbi:alpha/beta fold hydrolase [Fodinicurvata sp. EGI_FJ10296]|uniref:esterase/lipase family protein n=1 Tax=Fodinicurvata sp. EGI_FJ10296 TaxID=3231908 RepID=UPI0034561D00
MMSERSSPAESDGRDMPRHSGVVLVHGLGRTFRSMQRLERRLNREGFATHNFDYSARSRAFTDLVADFQSYLESLPIGGTRIDFVGHSLGGLLIRGVLAQPQEFEVGRIVMMATPNQGVGIIDRLARTGVPELLFGPSVKDLGTTASTFRSLAVPQAEIGIIAGTQPFHLLNPASWLNSVLQAEILHDGTVEVASTRLPVMADYLELPISHTFMPMDLRVIDQVVAFLRTGQFDHDADSRSQSERFLAAWGELLDTLKDGLSDSAAARKSRSPGGET